MDSRELPAASALPALSETAAVEAAPLARAAGGGLDPRRQAMLQAARWHGIELDPQRMPAARGRDRTRRGTLVALGAECRDVGARGPDPLAPSVPPRRGGAGRPPVRGWRRRPPHRRRSGAEPRLHQRPVRAPRRRPGRGRRIAARERHGPARRCCCAPIAASSRPTHPSISAGSRPSSCRSGARCATSASPRSRSAS